MNPPRVIVHQYGRVAVTYGVYDDMNLIGTITAYRVTDPSQSVTSRRYFRVDTVKGMAMPHNQYTRREEAVAKIIEVIEILEPNDASDEHSPRTSPSS